MISIWPEFIWVGKRWDRGLKETHAVSIAIIYPKFPSTLKFIGIEAKPLYMEKSLKKSNPSDFTSNLKSF